MQLKRAGTLRKIKRISTTSRNKAKKQLKRHAKLPLTPSRTLSTAATDKSERKKSLKGIFII
jgi:phage/plasmid primase-like uncharacterized protein